MIGSLAGTPTIYSFRMLLRLRAPARLESTAATAAPDFLDEVAALQTKLSPEHARLLGDGHEDIMEALSEAKLREVWEDINKEAKKHKLDTRAVELLTRMKDAKKGELVNA